MPYNPRHALLRAARSLPKWARAGILGVAASGSIAGLVVAAVPSGASVGSNDYSTAASGYKADGAQFRYVAATTYLRADSEGEAQPFAEIQTGCTSTSPGPEVELIPNPDGTWNANGDLGGMSGGSKVTSSGNPTFTAGQNVTLSIYYNKWTHEATFQVLNPKTGQVYSAEFNLGAATSLKCAGVGEVDIPAYSGHFQAPGSVQKLGHFSGIQLTTYSGHRAGLLSWWTTHRYLMVGDATTHSPVEAVPSSTDGSSFTVSLLASS